MWSRTYALVLACWGAFIAMPCCAQEDEWIGYTTGTHVTSLAINGNDVWAGTDGGLMHVDVPTGERTFFNKCNSGLPYNVIQALAVDMTGVLWIGTDFGLSRFDGVSWSMFDTTNSALDDNEVTMIATGPNGEVWLRKSANADVLQRFDGGVWHSWSVGIDSLPTVVEDMACDASGRLWMAAGNAGAVVFDGSNWTEYNASNSGLPNGNVGDVAIGIDGDVFFNDSGLVRFNGIGWSVYDVPATGIDSWVIDELVATSDGGVVLTTDAYYDPMVSQQYFPRCLRFDGNSWTELGEPVVIASFSPLAVDGSQRIWTGSLYRRELDGEWQAQDFSATSLTTNYVSAIHAGSGGRAWCSLWNSDVFEFDGSTWAPVGFNYGGVNFIGDLTTDPDGDLVLATNRGIYWQDGSSWIHYDHNNAPFPNDYVSIVQFDEEGALWVRGIESGIHQFDGEAWVSYNSQNSGLSSDDVRCIAQGGPGRLWVGTGNGAAGGGGLSLFDNGSWQTWTPDNSLLPLNSSVVSVAVDSTAQIWFVCDQPFDDDLLGHFTNGTMAFFDHANSELPEEIAQVRAFGEGRIWVVTAGDGLVSYDLVSNAWQRINRENSPLPSNGVVDLVADDYGNRWVATSSCGIAQWKSTGVPDGSDLVGEGQVNVFPDPMTGSGNVVFELKAGDRVTIELFDVRGSLVRSYVAQDYSSGEHSVPLDINGLMHGVYICRVRCSALNGSVPFLVLDE